VAIACIDIKMVDDGSENFVPMALCEWVVIVHLESAQLYLTKVKDNLLLVLEQELLEVYDKRNTPIVSKVLLLLFILLTEYKKVSKMKR
jgi:hypothetical protein